MQEWGEWFTELGFIIIPYSFAVYFPLRLLEYLWGKRYSSLIKSLWYLALGMLYIGEHVKVELVVTYICFIEAWDLFLEHVGHNEERRK